MGMKDSGLRPAGFCVDITGWLSLSLSLINTKLCECKKYQAPHYGLKPLLNYRFHLQTTIMITENKKNPLCRCSHLRSEHLQPCKADRNQKVQTTLNGHIKMIIRLFNPSKPSDNYMYHIL
jgi:hypothetical protein